MQSLRGFVAVALLTVALAGCQKDSKAKAKEGTATAGAGAATMELYVMSQCPYGVQVENALVPVAKQLGNALDLQFHYIGDGQPGSFRSLHGTPEVAGDIAQLCAQEQDPAKMLDFIACQNKAPREVASNWKSCAEELGLDAKALATCAGSDHGEGLLAASFEESRKKGATGSPTIYLNGKPYEGGRKSRDFLKAVCSEVSGTKPQPCLDIPEPPVVHAVFLSDARCAECDIHKLEPRLKGELGGLQVSYIDYASAEGKKMYDDLVAAGVGFKTLPSVLLAKDVEKDSDGFGSLKQYTRPVGDYYELRLGGSWDPTAEICDNGSDDDGDGQVDCADDGCQASMNCRPLKAKTLDLFVMSQCPYGAKALIALDEVVEHFGKELALDVHFIGGDQGGKLTSLHGQTEVDEDVRERCAIEHYAKNNKYVKYLACRSKDYRNADWQSCANEAGLDTGVIQRCFDGEGKKLVAESFALSDSLKIGASPTFLANNRRQFNAITAPDIQRQICTDNPDMAGCKEQIPGAPPAPAGSQAAAPAQCAPAQ
jgi:protein-disulfide isomerase